MRKPIKTKPDSQTKYCYKGPSIQESYVTGQFRKQTCLKMFN